MLANSKATVFHCEAKKLNNTKITWNTQGRFLPLRKKWPHAKMNCDLKNESCIQPWFPFILIKSSVVWLLRCYPALWKELSPPFFHERGMTSRLQKVRKHLNVPKKQLNSIESQGYIQKRQRTDKMKLLWRDKALYRIYLAMCETNFIILQAQ